jgi:tRNA-modifying protein YgfZ
VSTTYFQTDQQLLRVAGKDSLDYLQRVLTCNLKSLKPGQTTPGALLTGQGKLVAPLRVYVEEGGFTLETPGDCAESLQLRLERYIFSEDVTVQALESSVFKLFGSFNATEMMPAVDSYVDLSIGRLCALAAEEYHLITTELPQYLNLTPLTPEQFEIWRIEGGIPAWGKELNEALIPLNLGIDRAFDHNKGCYTGQEVISRATFVGHAPLELLGLIAPQPLELDTELTVDGDYVGTVTSAIYSPRLQATIGLARMRYQKVKPGEQVLAGSQSVEVTALPF